jgi:hypothetical protein
LFRRTQLNATRRLLVADKEKREERKLKADAMAD